MANQPVSPLIEDLRKRIFEDQQFRELLVRDTPAALKLVNIEPTHQNVALVRNVISAVEHLYQGFDEIDRFIT